MPSAWSRRCAKRRPVARRCCSLPKCRECSIAIASGRWARPGAEGEDDVLAAVRAAAKASRDLGAPRFAGAARARADKLVNRGFVIDDQGEIRARYDKIHLFDVDLPTGESWRESAMYQAGSRGGRGARYAGREAWPDDLLRPAISGAVRAAERGGAEVIAVPAAFTVPTGRAHWQVLMRARAIEAELFIVAAAQAGRHEDGRETYGHSLVADPWGEVLHRDGRRAGRWPSPRSTWPASPMSGRASRSISIGGRSTRWRIDSTGGLS